MTIRLVFHAPDGTQYASRAEAQRYVRACEFLDWFEANRGNFSSFPMTAEEKQLLAESLAGRWYLHDRQAKPKRGKPAFTGFTCPTCGGATETIGGEVLCVSCDPQRATRLRRKEMESAK